MLLKDILNKIKVEKVIGDTDIEIKDIQHYSPFVTEGSLFICIEGFKTDGQFYIKEAIDRGAVAIISEKETIADEGTVIRVEDARGTMASIANYFYNEPTKKLQLVGITGTNGKTSVTYMVKNIFEFCGRKIGLIGTISNWIGDAEVEAIRTTPESLDLQKMFSQMLQQSLDTCVMEVSSHALKLKRVDDCIYRIGLFTNLSPEHLDFHINMEDYREAKKKLFYKTILYNIINIDDAHGKIIAEQIKDLETPLLTFGIKEKADIYATNIDMSLKGVRFNINILGDIIHVDVKIPGMFTVYNVMAAAIICYCLGISTDKIGKALNSMESIPGRFEVVKEIEDFIVIIDYAHTPDALENVLKSARMFAKNRIITVFGCGGDRDRTKRAIMGEISGRLSDYTIITSDNPRTEEPLSIMEMIEEGVTRVTNKYSMIEDRKIAIQHAIKMAINNDIIIIAGKGHEATQTIGNRILPFDDYKIVLQVAEEERLI
ncbi:MAG: UDP-N-acetylmuramoyl-L-alanyl-D-glutamate--2,6-diaminopimelate ligase [Clostridiales bacterium]|nr:UDP-N-acetylmuramoyl-L-alanyl-D-glutamate--2,6-diaminopimelate ligase [Clostridiales bacterium]